MSEDQQPIDAQMAQKRRNKKRTITNPQQKTGHWSEYEHKTYVDFLSAHRPIMESQDQKKTSKIFKTMSEIIGTRTPSQCRSHHQKFNPFTHQVKKRQKGAGRKKKELDLQIPPMYMPYQNFAQTYEQYCNMMIMQPYGYLNYPVEQSEEKDQFQYDEKVAQMPFFPIPQIHMNYYYPSDMMQSQEKDYNDE